MVNNVLTCLLFFLQPEYFQDDVFVPTPDVEHPAQDAECWFKGENKQLEVISLQPKDMTECKECFFNL